MRLPSLTGLRFWAALLVVLYHLSRQLGELPLLSPLVWYGRSGVTFFFVLSGYVLAWTYAGSPVWAAVFLRRRLARIWPLHALTTLLSLAAYAAIGAALPLTAALWSVPLLHAWLPAAAKGGNPASWSLGDEAWFYLLFPLLLPLLAPLTARRLRAVAVACVLTGPLLWLAGAAVADPALRGWLLDYLPLTRTPQFLLGVVLGLAVRRGRVPRVPVLPAGLAVLGFHAALVPWHLAVPDSLWYSPWGASQLLAAPFFAALIVAAAQADLRGRAAFGQRVTVRLGEWSFAWYLVHEIAFRCWLAAYGRPTGGWWALLGAWLLLAGGSLAVAAALFRYVERPVERLLRGGPHRDARLPRPRRESAGARQRA
ncbi:acyltransferase family protein [Kitasatospora sp. NPDC096147]|uniref:acyltransferase family protein n=1 Tax=Kitasatospora sp. NPDC096147 TaxID=3364093 RepID=UPI0038090D75